MPDGCATDTVSARPSFEPSDERPFGFTSTVAAIDSMNSTARSAKRFIKRTI
jgi:hypothetical protein